MAPRLTGCIAALALLLAAGQAGHAAPAPWHQWLSKLDGRQYCAQADPGPGWVRVAGPFKDARCVKPGKPGQ